MKLLPLLALLGASATALHPHPAKRADTASPPKNWAVALFPSPDAIDIFGPLDPLWYLAFSRQLNLALISDTLDPVWIKPPFESLNRQNSSFWSSINPTHTYSSPPPDIEVLLVPGGPGVRLLNLTTQVEFVRRTYPKLRYLISVCTGAGILAQAGVLDDRAATTNKKAWNTIVAMGKNVQWKSPARWIVDGNIWTSSGVTAGLDLIFTFIEEVYGVEESKDVQSTVEYVRSNGQCDDPFAAVHGVKPTWECVERNSTNAF